MKRFLTTFHKYCWRLGAGLVGVLCIGIATDWLFPLDLRKARDLATIATDKDGHILRVVSAQAGHIRLPVKVQDIDPRFFRMLTAFEDQRFSDHWGVDPLAILRALRQGVVSGKIVSGASTLTMQTARLLEPRPRTLGAKFIEAFRALQLEAHFSKEEILDLYVTLAPYGGALNGVRAGALVWFGKSPDRLTNGEAALLVALPQAPSRIRPDRYPEAARLARAKVLDRAVAMGVINEGEASSAKEEPLPSAMRTLPFLAPHLVGRLVQNFPEQKEFSTTLDGKLQRSVESLARATVENLDPKASVAVIVLDAVTHEVRAYVGSANFWSEDRQGQVDMVRAIRSPGSALKPAIYGMTFDLGLAHPETVIRDAPTNFSGYKPANFNEDYYGDVSLRDALQKSLNVPAVALLDRIGPLPFYEKLGAAGIALDIGHGQPSLPIALGGVGTTLEDLTRLYASFVNKGRVPEPLYFQGQKTSPETDRLFHDEARWQIGRILLGSPRPEGILSGGGPNRAETVAYKTGTSYGFRDAWSIGFDSQHVVGIWVGHADGTPSPGQMGARIAAPLLFQVFEFLPMTAPAAGPIPPEGVQVLTVDNLPPALRRLGGALELSAWLMPDGKPEIVFPPDGAKFSLAELVEGVSLEAKGGRRPLQWMVNGSPIEMNEWRRSVIWRPNSPGFTDITVIDADGYRAEATIFLAPENSDADRR